MAYSGHYNQGLGMLNALYDHCQKIGDTHNAALAENGLGNCLMSMRKPEIAAPYLLNSIKLATLADNNWTKIAAYRNLARLSYLTGKVDKSLEYLNNWYRLAEDVGLESQVLWFQGLWEIMWAMKRKEYPTIPGLKLEIAIDTALKEQNAESKGVAYRYQALLYKYEEKSDQQIKRSLDLSIKYLKQSGSQVELAMTGIELGRYYWGLGINEYAEKWVAFADEIVSSFNSSLIPKDLQHLIGKYRAEKNLLHDIIVLGQEVVSIRETREAVNNILSTASRIASAERGAIFMLEGEAKPRNLFLRAAKNLTVEEVAEPHFRYSMDLVRKAATSKQGQIQTFDIEDKPQMLSRHQVRSSICVPMKIRGEVVGVLYLDNRLFVTPFQEKNLEVLSYFASQAAIALDNARAYEEIQVLNERLKKEKTYYEEQHYEDVISEEIIGKSTVIKNVIASVDKVADSDTTVLILGETGVGKELVASSIHRRSSRSDKPLICVNCSALPESLISSELFGHEKGAFTGASNRRIGRFELADGGTLFLDEIGELPMEVQVRLLRVLQSKEFERIGSSLTLQSDFRLIVATNRNLADEVNRGRFRKDLYYRLNVFPIEVPPLRSRTEDIPLLAHYFLKIHCDRLRKPAVKISRSMIERLQQYDWPGNVRELENVIERGVILSSDADFRIPELDANRLNPSADTDVLSLEENEKIIILKALKKSGGKIYGKGGAAEMLRIKRSTLNYRMKKLGISKYQALE